MPSLQSLFPQILTLHILAMAIGLGGATISDILFFRFLKDFRISKKEQEVLHILKNVILGSLIAVVVTGAGIYLSSTASYNASPAFAVKMIVVVVLAVNGGLLHAFVAPYLLHLNMEHHKKMGRKWHKLAFGLGGISFVSWYTAFGIAMMKRFLPQSFFILLGLYLLALILGVIASKLIEAYMTRRARKKN